MDTENNSRFPKKIMIGAILFMALFLLIILVSNLTAVNQWIGSVLRLLRPILMGLVIAYLCNPIFRFFERRILFRLRPQGLRRALSLLLTYVIAFSILLLILLLIVPQLIDSIITFISDYNSYISGAIDQINILFSNINEIIEGITGNEAFLEYLDEAEIRKEAADLFANLAQTSQKILDYLSNIDITPIKDMLGNAVSLVTDFIFALFISIYFLSSKEKRAAQMMKLRRALLSNKANEQLTKLIRTADFTFGRFLEGKILDSFIVGVLIYIAISIFNIPFALLIATFIAIANIIPIIGPLIGAIPTALILLLSAPSKVIPFLIIVIIVQQIDSNIISPKILGNNTGVSSLCVMIAITTMGTLWGFMGMILGVPIFATILVLTDEIITSRLQKKGLPSGLANYYANDAIVDPTKNAHTTTDKTVQRFEKKALAVRRRHENGETLNRKERFVLFIYRLAHKYRIFSEMTDETHVRFSAEQAAKDIALESEHLLTERRAAKATASANESDVDTGKEEN